MRLHAQIGYWPTGIFVGIGSVVIVLGCLVAGLFPVHPDGARIAVLAVVIGAFSWVCGDVVAAVVTAGIGCLLRNGFLADRDGVLRWHGMSDLRCMGVFLGAALVASAAARWWFTRNKGYSFDD
ncbi:MAG TPA: hypothetical protein VHC49_21345 [Mycobacteriales bacterium]|nr:hypothetical protein [Mycobacteriales bacterium]